MKRLKKLRMAFYTHTHTHILLTVNSTWEKVRILDFYDLLFHDTLNSIRPVENDNQKVFSVSELTIYLSLLTTHDAFLLERIDVSSIYLT